MLSFYTIINNYYENDVGLMINVPVTGDPWYLVFIVSSLSLSFIILLSLDIYLL